MARFREGQELGGVLGPVSAERHDALRGRPGQGRLAEGARSQDASVSAGGPPLEPRKMFTTIQVGPDFYRGIPGVFGEGKTEPYHPMRHRYS